MNISINRICISVVRYGFASIALAAVSAGAWASCDHAGAGKRLPNGRPAWTKGVDSLTFYNAGATQYDPAVMEGVKAFEARYGINVKVVGVPETNYFTKATRLLATGSSKFDTIDMYTALPMPDWAKNGWIKPVDCAVPEYLSQQWPKNIWRAAEHNGKHYFVPHILQPFILVWNKKMFQKAGLDPDHPPETLDQLVSYAKKLTKDTNGDGNVDQWGFIFPAGKLKRAPMELFGYFLGMQGDRLWRKDGSPGFDNEAGRKALQLIGDLVRKYKVSPTNVQSSSTANVAATFRSGGAAMVLEYTGSPVLAEFDSLGKKNVGGAAPPHASGVAPQYPIGLEGPAQYVNAKSRHPVAAAHLAVFMGTYQQGWREATLEKNVSPNLKVWQSPTMTEPKFSYLNLEYPFSDTVRTMLKKGYVPSHQRLVSTLDLFRQMIDSVITGSKQPKEAISYMTSKLKSKGLISK